MECDEFGLSEQQKCRHIVAYCTSDLQDVVKHLQGYSTINWELLCREMKELFWHRDRNDKVALDNLIVKANARQMDLRMYVLRYAGLSERLLNCKAISPYDRFNKFLDGISSPDLRRRIFDFCASKGWSICGWTSTNDCVPEFDAVKDFVLQQAAVSRMIYTYQQERKCHTYISQPLSNVLSTASSRSVSHSSPSSITELSKAIASLTESVKQSLNQRTASLSHHQSSSQRSIVLRRILESVNRANAKSALVLRVK